ncbi:MAG TPA: phenylacetate--CoA ligase family protein [Actinomycetota bacterium]|nr:phenylacetate--CoA ligase family protein [Actinomycetota bacterium]
MDAGSRSDSPYWNPRHETMPRDQLDALQVHKLRNLVEWTHAKVPWQSKRLSEAGVTAESIQTLDDLRRIRPFTRDDWMQGQVEQPPFGPILAAEPEAAIRYHMTSGTTGKTPIRVLDGMKDWEWIAEMWCYGLWGFGVRPADSLFVAFGYATFIGFWGLHYAGEKMGCLVLPGGAMTTDQRVKAIVDLGATVVASTPTYALRMAQEAKSLGIDLAGGPVQRLILSGEPAGSIPATKRLIEELWGAKAADTAGMTELGTIMIFECADQPGGTHIIEDHYIEEVLEPDSGRPVGYGEMGERVVTSFGRGFIPVLRYRTRDLVVKVPGSTCACGRTFDIYDGGIRGRVDDMKLVRGTNVYPRAVEAIVREHPEVDEFQIHLFTADGIRDEIEILVEIPDPNVDAERLLAGLGKQLADAHEGLRFGVRQAEDGSLPRFELKARRLLDERTVIGTEGERRQT